MQQEIQEKIDAEIEVLTKAVGKAAADNLYNKISGKAYTCTGDKAEFIQSELAKINAEGKWHLHVKMPITKFMFQMIFGLVKDNILQEPFSVEDVNRKCTTLLHSPSFLSQHAVGNTSKKDEYFIRVDKGKYKINREY